MFNQKNVEKILTSYVLELQELLKCEVVLKKSVLTYKVVVKSFGDLQLLLVTFKRNMNTDTLYVAIKVQRGNNQSYMSRSNDLSQFNKFIHDRIPYFKKLIEVYRTKIYLYRYSEKGVNYLSLHTYTNREVEMVPLEKVEPTELLDYLLDHEWIEPKKMNLLYEALTRALDDEKIKYVLYELMKNE